MIPVHNEAHRLRETVLSIRETADVPYEIIVVDDVSTDGCTQFLAGNAFQDVRLIRSETPLGVAGARNLGARHAVAAMVMFMDGHCYPEPGWLPMLTSALARLGRGVVGPRVTVHGNPDASGFGMTLNGPALGAEWLPAVWSEPYPVPAACGCVQLFYKAWFDQIGGYDTMRTYGVEDMEISMRSWLLGGPVYIVPRATVAHYFRCKTTCNVSWSDVLYNSLRMAHLHFSGRRLQRVEDHWREHLSFSEARRLLRESDIEERRSWMDARRRNSADWYCDKFGIPI